MSAHETQFPVVPLGMGRAFDDAPVEIDGMRVLFDKRVTLFPVMLVEAPKKAAGRAEDARSP